MPAITQVDTLRDLLQKKFNIKIDFSKFLMALQDDDKKYRYLYYLYFNNHDEKLKEELSIFINNN